MDRDGILCGLRILMLIDTAGVKSLVDHWRALEGVDKSAAVIYLVLGRACGRLDQGGRHYRVTGACVIR